MPPLALSVKEHCGRIMIFEYSRLSSLCMKKILTLCLATRDGKILLGMKKRGFGAGRWNGFGGKVEVGEAIKEGAIREMREESMMNIRKMEEVGIHEFEFADKQGEILEVHVFRVDEWTGDPTETEEMKPRWFGFDEIPYDEMWPDDIHWLPLFLAGRKFRTRFLFGPSDSILKNEVSEVESL